MMPSGPSAHLADRLAIGDDGEHDVGHFRHRARRVRPAHAAVDQRFRLLLGAVPAGDLVACGLQARHHAKSHHAEADKSNSHACSPVAFDCASTPSCSRGPRRSNSARSTRPAARDDAAPRDSFSTRSTITPAASKTGLVMLHADGGQRRRQPVCKRHVVEAGHRNVCPGRRFRGAGRPRSRRSPAGRWRKLRH